MAGQEVSWVWSTAIEATRVFRGLRLRFAVLCCHSFLKPWAVAALALYIEWVWLVTWYH